MMQFKDRLKKVSVIKFSFQMKKTGQQHTSILIMVF